MKNLFFLSILVLFTAESVMARRYQRPRVDIKLPTQKLIEAQSWNNVLAANASTILNDNAGGTSAAAATVSSGFGSLDYPRNLSITPGGTTADVAACVITVSGTDFNNDAMSEDFTFIANQTTIEVGAKAFRTVTSVAFPASCEDSPFGATWDVGSGEILGASRCMAGAADWLIASVDNVKEGTAPTVLANTSTIESNTIDFNTAFDGAKDYKFFFIQSYGCD